MRRLSWVLGAFLVLGSAAGCSDDKTKVGPEASALRSSAPKTANAKTFVVDGGASTVGFMMDAPDEKIRGKAPGSAEGKVFIDPKDLSQTTGNVIIDVDKLELFQRKKGEDGNFTSEVKQPKQNEHARAWLEIDDSTPEATRKDNRRIEFRIDSISDLSQKDVTTMKGAERTVTFKANGDFLLHTHTAKKTVEMKATFTFDGDKPTAVVLKTEKPFAVNLAEHDVRPRDSFGKLATKTLDQLGSKVAKDAQVDFEIRLMIEGGKPGPPMPAESVPMAPTGEPAGSAAESASAAPSASGAPSAGPAPSASAKPK